MFVYMKDGGVDSTPFEVIDANGYPARGRRGIMAVAEWVGIPEDEEPDWCSCATGKYLFWEDREHFFAVVEMAEVEPHRLTVRLTVDHYGIVTDQSGRIGLHNTIRMVK